MIIKVLTRLDGPRGWLELEAQVYSFSIRPRAELKSQLMEEVDDIILGKPEVAGLAVDEVGVLIVSKPFHHIVVFDTEAYICNDRGDTVERIVPKRLVGSGS